MAPFGRASVDPELAGRVGRRRVLAAGRTSQGQVLALRGELLYNDAGGVHELGWHEVDRGGWDPETNTLRWTTVEGKATELELTEPGLLPDVFNERVMESIAVAESISLGDAGAAVISARRDLADPSSELVWQVTPAANTSPEQIASDPTVSREVDRLRSEYDANFW